MTSLPFPPESVTLRGVILLAVSQLIKGLCNFIVFGVRLLSNITIFITMLHTRLLLISINIYSIDRF